MKRRTPRTAPSITPLAPAQATTARGGNSPWFVAMRTASTSPSRPRPLAELSLAETAEARGGTAGLGTGLLLGD